MNKIDNNEIEKAIATINHNLECLEEAEQYEKDKHEREIKDIDKERKRLKKLLSFYVSISKRGDGNGNIQKDK